MAAVLRHNGRHFNEFQRTYHPEMVAMLALVDVLHAFTNFWAAPNSYRPAIDKTRRNSGNVSTMLVVINYTTQLQQSRLYIIHTSRRIIQDKKRGKNLK